MRVRWTAPALRDLEAIGDYIARDNPTAADQTISRMFECADLLAA
jgi:toxin ParE1/3/4